MDTVKLQDTARLVGAIRWGAIASGVFIALALQTVLLLLGLGFGLSVGDKIVEGGYALWAILAQLTSLGIGAALAANVSHGDRRMGGIVAGVMTWAVALVVGGAVQGTTLMQAVDRTGVWSSFLGAALGLGAAIIGGALGGNLGRSARPSVTTTQPLGSGQTHPIGH